MTEPVVTFDNVSKSYPQYREITAGFKYFLLHLPQAIKATRQARYEAIREISFEVNKGDAVGIIGRNGAGKSTTLGLIAGVLKPTSGRVVVNERVSPMLELGAGFHHELTGEENIFLNGILMGMTRDEVQQKYEEIVAFSELGSFIDQPIRTYSTGMLARLGFSVVSSLDPEILLIDEILAVGDIDFQKKCINKMLGFKESGVTIVFVSHAMDSILKICNRVIWIENHRIKQIGPAAEVVAEYQK